MKTGLTTESGRTGRHLLPRTKPGAEIESGPCHMSGTDAPAQTSESLGRYERRGETSDVFETYCLVEGHEERYSCWCKCVSGCLSALYVYSCLNVIRDER